MQQTSRGKRWAGGGVGAETPPSSTRHKWRAGIPQGPRDIIRVHHKIPRHHPFGLETPDNRLSAHSIWPTGSDGAGIDSTGERPPEDVCSASVCTISIK